MEERRNDPSKAEIYKTHLRQIFDNNSYQRPGYLTEEECLSFLESRQQFEKTKATGIPVKQSSNNDPFSAPDKDIHNSGIQERHFTSAMIINEQRNESFSRIEYRAIASLSADQINVGFEDVIRAD